MSQNSVKPSTSRQSKQLYEFGPFRLDPAEARLLRDGEPVPLTPKAFEVLLFLVQNSGQLVDKEKLMERVWADSFVEENNVKVTVSMLRKVLEEGTEGSRYIETVPRRGYRFTAPVRELILEEPALIVREQIRTSVLVEETDEPPEGKVAGNCTTFAVLPFKQLFSGDQSEEYLGLGLADALTTRLSSVRSLMVRPTSAIAKYRDNSQDAVSAGRELSVDYVLDGRLRRSGDRIRITLQVISV